jgi:hypothetical protein
MKKPWELDPLPHIEFENDHSPTRPGRSYRFADLLEHAYRKFAMLAGIHESNQEHMLEEGKKLYNAQ